MLELYLVFSCLCGVSTLSFTEKFTTGVLKELTSLQDDYVDLRNSVKEKMARINDLENSILKETYLLNKHEEEVKVLKERLDIYNNVYLQQDISRSDRMLQNQPVQKDFNDFSDEGEFGAVIAFYAYMSQISINPAANYTLVFDKVKTNIAAGYDPSSGVFTVPEDGVYAFLWKIRLYNAEHSTQLMVNGNVLGATFLRSTNGDDGSVTGEVVVQLSRGDLVYVRIHTAYAGNGNVQSNEHGQPSFSGWKIN